MRWRLTATLAALRRNRAASNRNQAARARHDMRIWQVERRKRTRHLIELDEVDGLHTRHQSATVVTSNSHEETSDE